MSTRKPSSATIAREVVASWTEGIINSGEVYGHYLVKDLTSEEQAKIVDAMKRIVGQLRKSNT